MDVKSLFEWDLNEALAGIVRKFCFDAFVMMVAVLASLTMVVAPLVVGAFFCLHLGDVEKLDVKPLKLLYLARVFLLNSLLTSGDVAASPFGCCLESLGDDGCDIDESVAWF